MSFDDIAIRVTDIGKRYEIYDSPSDRLKQFVVPRIYSAFPIFKNAVLGSNASPPSYHREFWALRGISFDVRKGDSVGIIGLNGSGKSTLLQLICGTLSPTTGAVQTKGRVAALLELGSGFNTEFTGRENVYMNGAVLGLDTTEISARFDSIAAFADIGEFINRPVKTYSSGMVVRLAFAISVCVDPEILVIDEALAVGDAAFQFKCLERMKQLTESGTTLLFVSHDMSMVKQFCDYVLYLEHGREKARGQPEVVAEQYFFDIRDAQRRAHAGGTPVVRKIPLGDSALPSFGTHEGRILSAFFVPDGGSRAVIGCAEPLRLRIEMEYDPQLPNVALSIFLSDVKMIDIAGKWFTPKPHTTTGNGMVLATVEAEFSARFKPGTYFVTLRLESQRLGNDFFPIDKHPAALTFDVAPYQTDFLGIVGIDFHEVSGAYPKTPDKDIPDMDAHEIDSEAARQDNFLAKMGTLRGGVSEQEALFLSDLAAKTAYGHILEVGSYRGKSAVAICSGGARRRYPTSPALYCVEPHTEFVGVYGGHFGPEDRGGFYRTMLDMNMYREAALVNLESITVAPGWKLPLGMVFIDGDHSTDGVRQDVECWRDHIVPGGYIAFDDATDPAIGPAQAIASLVIDGDFQEIGREGKVVALQKAGYTSPPPSLPQGTKLRILVVTTNLVMSGGMLRFERVGRLLLEQGHEYAICAVHATKAYKWSGSVPILTLAEAWKDKWDVTMVPGRAGFDEVEYSGALEIFTDKRFGLRVQHILNDQHLADEFLKINSIFTPHMVLFNNRHWEPGSFTKFSGNEFHYLIGGVDCEHFSNIQRPAASSRAQCVIGGQSGKNPVPLIEALFELPSDYRLVLFGNPPAGLPERYSALIEQGRLEFVGILGESELAAYYSQIDVLVSPEANAGWANVVAEAMATGIPVVCSSAGTADIAIHRKTAIVLDVIQPRSIAAAVQEIWNTPSFREEIVLRAKTAIRSYDWRIYSAKLLRLLHGGKHCHYYHSPESEIFGKWPLEARAGDLREILPKLEHKTVLEIGCAEGLISRLCLEAGAALVHGIERDPERVRKAYSVCGEFADRSITLEADIVGGLQERRNGLPLEKYDVVLYLGVHHHLEKAIRNRTLIRICELCDYLLAVRMPDQLFESEGIDELIVEHGFQMTHQSPSSVQQNTGMLRVYERGTSPPQPNNAY